MLSGGWFGDDHAAAQAALDDLLRGVLTDALGFTGTEMIRRIIGLGAVPDLLRIEDPAQRARCEQRALRFARELVVGAVDLLNATQGAEQSALLATASRRLGAAAQALGALEAQRTAWSRTHDHRSRTLPDDHPDLLEVRQDLASTLAVLGELDGAREHSQRASRSHHSSCITMLPWSVSSNSELSPPALPSVAPHHIVTSPAPAAGAVQLNVHCV